MTAIIAANLVTARFGPAASIINAFLFIGLDLTSRDALHETWKRDLVWKMGLLIAAGSVLSWVLNRDAGPIALASFVAFAAAAITDTVIYSALKGRAWVIKVNGSNIASALVDSIVFPTIAFGGFSLAITAGQFAAKVLGGFIWSLVMERKP